MQKSRGGFATDWSKKMNNIMMFLDKSAYNSPDNIPQEFQRNDKVFYRLYFRFMVCLYRLYSAGVNKDILVKFKEDFANDFENCEVLFKSALKSCREQNRLNFALMECRKNADDCPKCKAVSEILGKPTAENEPDIEVQ